jgi:hypothetical protein
MSSFFSSRRLPGVALALVALAALAGSASAQPLQPRFVVFEGFYNPG